MFRRMQVLAGAAVVLLLWGLCTDASNWAEVSGEVEQNVVIPFYPSPNNKHWGPRYGFAMVVTVRRPIVAFSATYTFIALSTVTVINASRSQPQPQPISGSEPPANLVNCFSPFCLRPAAFSQSTSSVLFALLHLKMLHSAPICFLSRF